MQEGWEQIVQKGTKQKNILLPVTSLKQPKKQMAKEKVLCEKFLNSQWGSH